MRLVSCLFSIAAVSIAAPPAATREGVRLNTSLADNYLILNDVFLNGVGPFRMLLDTGNATTIVRPRVARRLDLKPGYAIELVNASKARTVPAAILEEVRVGVVIDRSVEAVVGDVFRSDVDGVLGSNWLLRHDYMLDYHHRRVALDGVPPGSGIRVPLRSKDGTPVVAASIDGCSRELVIDSGASAVILFEKLLAGRVMVQVETNAGSILAQRFTALFSLSGERERLIDAFRIDAGGLGPGVLPASAFQSVFVSNLERFVEFTPHHARD
jgi:predicted aspartyl protease